MAIQTYNLQAQIRRSNGTKEWYNDTTNSFSIEEGDIIEWVYLRVYDTNGGTFTCYPMLNYGNTAKPYTPYIEPSVFDFPKTPTPMGTTIDLENKKIVDICGEDTINGVSKAFRKISDAWYRTGFFSFEVSQALSQNGNGNIFKSNLFVATQGFKQGTWEWNILSFEKGTERYLLAGNNNNHAFFIMPNADLGILETDTDEVKLQAARTWLENNPVTVRYLLATPTERDFTDEEKAVGNKYQVWSNGTERVIGNDGKEYGVDNTLTQDYIAIKE